MQGMGSGAARGGPAVLSLLPRPLTALQDVAIALGIAGGSLGTAAAGLSHREFHSAWLLWVISPVRLGVSN